MLNLFLATFGPLIPYAIAAITALGAFGAVLLRIRHNARNEANLQNLQREEKIRRANQKLIDDARAAAADARSPHANPSGLHRDKYQRD